MMHNTGDPENYALIFKKKQLLFNLEAYHKAG